MILVEGRFFLTAKISLQRNFLTANVDVQNEKSVELRKKKLFVTLEHWFLYLVLGHAVFNPKLGNSPSVFVNKLYNFTVTFKVIESM